MPLALSEVSHELSAGARYEHLAPVLSGAYVRYMPLALSEVFYELSAGARYG